MDPADPVDDILASFEKRVDASDPKQAKLLDAMREHTREIHLARGTWNKPSTFRNWNSYGGPAPGKAKKPLEIDSYREYVEHKKKEAGGDGAVVKRLTE